ncbi:GTP cyclohydrolase II [Dimargaris verticillata]|uniref:GTP cyclohydrolase II n=1 Tax=Dimargaris verticillata TaxID=2761393 RepID=A0A9W8B5T3_9FUNG|nr:GTP cyclohydrolase II [Dimargaris verticillata]
MPSPIPSRCQCHQHLSSQSPASLDQSDCNHRRSTYSASVASLPTPPELVYITPEEARHQQQVAATEAPSTNAPLAPVNTWCEVRARIPYPDGEFRLFLYRNSHDSKEHMAIVFGEDIDSQSLNTLRGDETDDERAIRGAKPRMDLRAPAEAPSSPTTMAPLVRIHSECFTGETVSSVRCDCGYQLAEAMRLMQLEKRGVILYLRQEGRGIGLLDKLRAYNLQDMGHDTVTANLMLNHPADARTYDVAYGMLRDLRLTTIRLLTNNPEKLQQMENAGIHVQERIPMIPRWWQDEGLGDVVQDQAEMDIASSSYASQSLTPVLAQSEAEGFSTGGSMTPIDADMANLELHDGVRDEIVALAPTAVGSAPALDRQPSATSLNSTQSSPSTLVWPLSPGDGVYSHLSSSKHLFTNVAQAQLLRRPQLVHDTRRTRSSTDVMAEANRYLRVKVQRMGHLLDLPNGKPALPANLSTGHGPHDATSPLSIQTKNLATKPSTLGFAQSAGPTLRGRPFDSLFDPSSTPSPSLDSEAGDADLSHQLRPDEMNYLYSAFELRHS